MRGSVVKRKDKFYVVTDIPPGPARTRPQKWHASSPTRKQAEKELRKVLVELDEQRYVEPSSRTLEAYLLEDWLPAMGTTIRPSILRIYREVITGCLFPALGHHPLSDLDLRAQQAARSAAPPLRRRRFRPRGHPKPRSAHGRRVVTGTRRGTHTAATRRCHFCSRR